MQSYAIVQEYARFDTVTFYTLKGEDSKLSETDNFFEKRKRYPELEDQFEQIALWLATIGNDPDGATAAWFRPERNCVALPPKGKQYGTETGLRLYCLRVSDRVVILFNGGLKTTRTAQECPDVSCHFYNAQSWTKQLNELGIETWGQEITNLIDLFIKQ